MVLKVLKNLLNIPSDAIPGSFPSSTSPCGPQTLHPKACPDSFLPDCSFSSRHQFWHPPPSSSIDLSPLWKPLKTNHSSVPGWFSPTTNNITWLAGYRTPSHRNSFQEDVCVDKPSLYVIKNQCSCHLLSHFVHACNISSFHKRREQRKPRRHSPTLI